MPGNKIANFVVDCPKCRAKVAAVESGRAEQSGYEEEIGEPWAQRLQVGACPRCSTLLVGESWQLDFEGYDSGYDRWSDVVRVFPFPPKTFQSVRIPRVVTDSLTEADRSLQANANIAACVMFGRALEAVCQNVLQPQVSNTSNTGASTPPKKRLMLAAGIKKLLEMKIIDDRLFDWSQQLHAFRNIAAHPDDISISREDAQDLQTFVYAIIEYIYDLSDRYIEFKARADKRAQRKSPSNDISD